MRVLMIADFPLPSVSARGGVEVAVCNLVPELGQLLKADGGELRVLSFQSDGSEGEHAYEWGKHIWVPRIGPVFRRLRVDDPIEVRKQSEVFQADLVHAQACASWLHKVSVPSVLTLHGLQEDVAFGGGVVARIKSLLKSRLLIALENRGRKKVGKIIAINKYNITRLSQYESKMVVVENAIDARLFKGHIENVDGRDIIYCGRLVPGKDILSLLKAVQILMKNGEMADRVLQLWYPDEDAFEWYLADCKSLAKELGIESYLRWNGPMNKVGLISAYSSGAISVLPSLKENSPMSICESLTLGIPVVATDVGGVKFLIENGRNGSVVPLGDLDKFAGEMSRWLNASHTQVQEASSGSEIVERWSPKSVALKTVDVYKSLLNKL